jgi:DNA-binding NarL/FixJ family response regulator
MEETEKSTQVDLAIVLGYIAVKDLKTIDKKVAVLTQLGFTNKEMARICGTTENAIRAFKSQIKKGSKGKVIDIDGRTSNTQENN